MVGTAEGESFQGPDGLSQVATIWPGFLALNRPERLAAEAGRGALVFIVTGHRSSVVCASALLTERGKNRTLKEARGTGPAPPGSRDKSTLGRKSGGVGLSGPGSGPPSCVTVGGHHFTSLGLSFLKP